MCIKKRGGGFGREEDAVWGILGNGAMFIMELEVFEAELHRALMVCYLCVLTRAQTEEEYSLHEIGLVFCKWGGVCCYSSLGDKAKMDCVFAFGWGVLIGVVT